MPLTQGREQFQTLLERSDTETRFFEFYCGVEGVVLSAEFSAFLSNVVLVVNFRTFLLDSEEDKKKVSIHFD